MFAEYQGRVLSVYNMFTEYQGRVLSVHNMFTEYVAGQGSLNSQNVNRI
jgi:hypothetical protein